MPCYYFEVEAFDIQYSPFETISHGGVVKRAHLLVLSATVSTVGWGTVLPYQYAYASDTRGWGGLVAAAASSLFSIGALIAAPLGGRLADRRSPVRVAIVARLAAAVAALSLVVAGSPVTFLAGMLALGLAVTAGTPAQQVLVLRWVDGTERRRIFALMFSGQALGMAVGAFAAGYLVDLGRTNGMWSAFVVAAGGFVAASLLLALAGRGASPAVAEASVDGVEEAVGTMDVLRLILHSPALRWTALITVTLALGFYAQFESGLPAYALTVLHAPVQSVGTAAAVNCVVIIVLQMAIVRWTARRSAPSLLLVVGLIWVMSWVLLAAASQLPGQAATMFIMTYGVFAVGETMYAPVLNPLTASLAPAGMVGTTLGFFAALQTGVSAVGPLLAGLALGAGQAALFVLAHLLICSVAVYAAWRLRALLPGSRVAAAPDADRLDAQDRVDAQGRPEAADGFDAPQLDPAERERVALAS